MTTAWLRSSSRSSSANSSTNTTRPSQRGSSKQLLDVRVLEGRFTLFLQDSDDLVGVAVAATAAVVVIVVDLIHANRPIPEFPSLADAPDPSLAGAVAYYDTEACCVRFVDASGAAPEDAYCFEAADDDQGPQLAFRPDGPLEVTM